MAFLGSLASAWIACAGARGGDMNAGERVASALGGGAPMELPAYAIGGWQYFQVDGRPGGFVSSTGVATLAGQGPWVEVLSAGPPADVARALAGAWGEGRIEFVQPPTLALLDGTGRVFEGVFRAPPSTALQRLRVEARPGVPVVFLTSPAEDGTDRVVTLISQIGSSSGPSRARLVRELGATGDRRGTAAIVPLLTDRWADLRKAAAVALGAIGDSAAVGPLGESLLAERDAFVAADQVGALRKIGGTEAKAVLAGAGASHSDGGIRAAAAAAAATLQ